MIDGNISDAQRLEIFTSQVRKVRNLQSKYLTTKEKYLLVEMEEQENVLGNMVHLILGPEQ